MISLVGKFFTSTNRFISIVAIQIMNFLVVGNITKDLIRTRDKEEYSFGGTSYSGITAAQLGYQSRILSRGNNELSEWIKHLHDMGIVVSLQPDRNVTLFVNDYTAGERRQSILGYTQKIDFTVEDKTDVIHIDPKFQEVGPELVRKAREKCDVLSLDVQGLVRDTKDSHVIGKFWSDREQVLPLVDVLKVGKPETSLVSRLRDYKKICEELHAMGARIIALTFGNNGSLVYDGEFYELPIFKTKTVDKTGAGDTYGTSLALRYYETGNVLDSALFATAAASFVVEDFGPRKIARRQDVNARYEILKKIKVK